MIRIERHQLGFADRIPPRPPRLMQAEFAEQFDFDTFAYDVFSRGDISYLISPPNARDEWERALQIIQLDGKPLASRACRLHQGKVDKLIVDGPARSVQWPGHSLALPDLPRSGIGKNILYTLQKDNDPKWIQDWIDWHVRHHRIDAVVIYDNNSQRYPVDVLRQALHDSSCRVVLTECPFRFGPAAHMGSEWDSDYLSCAMFEHVRYFYGGADSLLLNLDVDELLVTRDHAPIDELMSPASAGHLFDGRWIHLPTVNTGSEQVLNHAAHRVLDTTALCPPKWIVRLGALDDELFMHIHDIDGDSVSHLSPRQALYLHHWQISTNWKYDRSLAADLGDRPTLRLADPQDVFRRVSPVMFLRWLKDSNMRRLRGWRWRLKRWRG